MQETDDLVVQGRIHAGLPGRSPALKVPLYRCAAPDRAPKLDLIEFLTRSGINSDAKRPLLRSRNLETKLMKTFGTRRLKCWLFSTIGVGAGPIMG